MSFAQLAFNRGEELPYNLRLIWSQLLRQSRNIKTASRKQDLSSPPAPTVAQAATAITGGFQFKWNTVGAKNVSGYRIYKSTTNNAPTAAALDFVAQPPYGYGGILTYQDITTGTPFYWVEAVNEVGKPSPRVPMAGSASPTAPPSGGGSGSTSGGGSGAGSGAGTGGGGGGNRRVNLL